MSNMSAQNSPPPSGLTSGKLLARNTVWNLLGSGIPMVVALVCIPPLIRGLGTDRFGVLTLAWALVGYAGLFDLGLGRALTKLVAERLGTGDRDEVYRLAQISLILMVSLGVCGGLLMGLFTPWFVNHALKIPKSIQWDSLRSFYLLALSLPIVLMTSGLRGLLQAYQRFDLINLVGIPLGIISFATPLFIVRFTSNLWPVVAVLILIDLIGCVIFGVLCWHLMPGLQYRVAWPRSTLKSLLSFGGWMTVSNVIGPLMVTIDRFLVGALVSIAAVAYYATPYEVATKLWVVPGALIGVLFPAFSTSFAQDVSHTSILFARALKSVFIAVFPIVLLLVAFADRGLSIWLGNDFSQHSARVLQWLAAGVFVNSLGQVPFALIQGVGRPDITAKFHLIELPCYLAALLCLTHAYGVTGTAIAWFLRVLVDSFLLLFVSTRLLHLKRALLLRSISAIFLALLIFAISSLPMESLSKLFIVLIALLVFVVVAWGLVISPAERMTVRLAFKRG